MGSRFTNAATIPQIWVWSLSLLSSDGGTSISPNYKVYPWNQRYRNAALCYAAFLVSSRCLWNVLLLHRLWHCFHPSQSDAINPARDIPIAAFLTIGTATALYALVGLVLTGMTSTLPTGCPSGRLYQVSFCCPVKNRFVMNMAVTVFACILGQPKIFAAISVTDCCPKTLAVKTPWRPTRSVVATLVPDCCYHGCLWCRGGLIDMIAAGCLLSMSLVCAGMLACRFNNAPGQTRQQGHWSTVVFFVNSIFLCWSINTDQHWIIKSCQLPGWPVFPPLPHLHVRPQGDEFETLSTSATIKEFRVSFDACNPCLAILANNYVLTSISWSQIKLFILGPSSKSFYLFYGLHHSKLGQEIEAVKSFGKF